VGNPISYLKLKGGYHEIFKIVYVNWDYAVMLLVGRKLRIEHLPEVFQCYASSWFLSGTGTNTMAFVLANDIRINNVDRNKKI
jgi:hypothetical protein